MAKMVTFYWRDIPSHVVYKAGREKHRQQLDPKFETAIDRAAMRAGKGSSCLLYTSPSPRDATLSRMPSSA